MQNTNGMKKRGFRATASFLVVLQLLALIWGGWTPSAEAASVYAWGKYKVTDVPQWKMKDDYVNGGPGMYTVNGYSAYLFDKDTGSLTVSGSLQNNTIPPGGGRGGVFTQVGPNKIRAHENIYYERSDANGNIQTGNEWTWTDFTAVPTTPIQGPGEKVGVVTSPSASAYPANGMYADGFWYVSQGANSSPALNFTNPVDQKINLKSTSNKAVISAKVTDVNNDQVTVAAVVGGVTKTAKAAAGTTAVGANISLEWTAAELPAGTYKNVIVSISDGINSTQSYTYANTITVDKTPIVFYDKYQVQKNPTYSLHYNGVTTISRSSGDLFFSAYKLIPAGVGTFELTGNGTNYGSLYSTNQWTSYPYFTDETRTILYEAYDRAIADWVAVTVYTIVRDDAHPISTRGALIESNINELDGTYPADGVHTDGFWYVRKTSNNSFPTLTINQKELMANAKTESIEISGNVTDIDGDPVDVQATIAGVTQRKTITNTKNNPAWTLTWPVSEIPEGKYVNPLVYATDDKGGVNSYSYQQKITIDKSNPQITITPSLKASWSNQDAELKITYWDAVSGIAPENLKYKVTSSPDAPDTWDTAPSWGVQDIKLTDDGVWYVHAKARDLAGNESTLVSNPIRLDKTAPAIQITAEQNTWLSDPAPIKIDYADTGSGIDLNERKYKVTSSPDLPTEWDTAERDSISMQIDHEGVWYVHAKANDVAGNSAQVSSQPIQYQKKPTAPALLLQEAGADFVDLSWTLPDTSFIDGYAYEAKDLTTGKSISPTLPEHSWKEGGLEPGTEYQYEVTVRNHVGESKSEELKVLTLPARPTKLKVEPISKDSSRAEVSFDEVKSAQNYEIIAKEADTQKVVYSDSVTNAGKHAIDKLEPGKQYNVSVTAINASGRSEAAVVGFLSLPAAPGEFKSVQVGVDWVTLGWEAVETAADYDLSRSNQSIYTGDQLTYTDEELTSSTPYDYQISARNDSGFGDIAYLNVLTLPASTRITVDEITSDGAIVSLTPIEGVDRYVVTLDGEEYESLDSDAERYAFTGLRPGTRYEIGIYGVNASGAGVAGTAAVLTLPDVALHLTADEITETSAHLHWAEVNSATHYKVMIDSKTYEVSGTDLEVPSLKAGTKYPWKVVAGNATGYGTASEENAVLTLPSAPDGIKEDKVTTNSAMLIFPKVTSATSYIVTYGMKELETEEPPIEIESLQGGMTYSFTIIAVNGTGRSAATLYEVTTLPVPVDLEGVQQGKIGQDTAEFVWEPVKGAEEYIIRDGEKEWITKTPPIILDGLESGKIYSSITITPVSKGGEGESTNLPSFETLPTSNFTVTAKSGKKKVDYEVTISSENETIVASIKGKEFYRGKKHQFSLSSLTDGQNVTVEVWTENSKGDRSEVKSIEASTLPAPPPAPNPIEGQSENLTRPVTDTVLTPDIKDSIEDSGQNQGVSDQSGGSGFADISSLYNRDQIMKLNEMGIVKGVSDNQFDPYRSITRAEFAALIVRALDLKEDSNKPMSFADVQQTAWYYSPLKAASDHQVIDGFSKTRFGPKETITREQAAKMLANAIGAKQPAIVTFTDERLIATWAEGEVKALAGMQIITGYPDGSFKPKNLLNRAESVSLIYNTLGLNVQ